ncbi:DUF973 family protein [Sulfolobus tengchongensis]|uniref:DUF973 family protein n=1 Tax=Sulfolobus tengchongensis TaxID=207809 RepID=A0AAX4L3T3_9CREN
MPILCPNCGYTNPDGAKFCMNCGSSLTQQISTTRVIVKTFKTKNADLDSIRNQISDIMDQIEKDTQKGEFGFPKIGDKKPSIRIVSKNAIENGYLKLEIQLSSPASITSAYIKNPYISATYISESTLNSGNNEITIYFGDRSSLVSGERYTVMLGLNLNGANIEVPVMVRYQS